MSKRDRFNITIYRGETFSTLVELKDATGAPISLTSSQIQSQCRNKSSNSVVFTFVCSILNPSADGKFSITLPSGTSSPLTPQKNLVYDVKITFPSGEIKHWLGGDVEIRDTITQ